MKSENPIIVTYNRVEGINGWDEFETLEDAEQFIKDITNLGEKSLLVDLVLIN